MEKLFSQYRALQREGVYLFDRDMDFCDGGAKAVTICLPGCDTWGIFMDVDRIETLAEEKCILFHECGHYATGATHQVASPFDLVEKHEYKADKWAIAQLIPPEAYEKALADGHTELWSLAEHFNVTEAFMQKAVCLYTHGNLDVAHYADAAG